MTPWHWAALIVLTLIGSWLLLAGIWFGMALFSYLAGAVGL